MKKVITIIILSLGIVGSTQASETVESTTEMDELRTLIHPDPKKSEPPPKPIPLVDVIGPYGSEALIEIPRPPEGQLTWQ